MTAVSPDHYKAGNLEAIDVIDAFSPDSFTRGNAIKYLLRLGKKDAPTQEVGKIFWYLLRWLQDQGMELPDLVSLLEEYPTWGEVPEVKYEKTYIPT